MNLFTQKKPKISIIIPNFNSEDSIEETIKSVLTQTYKKWELIIVDDNSNQKTKEILLKYKKYKKIKLFFLKKNKGAGFCRNFAIQNSKSDFLAFIDSDDLREKNKLDKQIEFMKKENCFFSYTYYKTFNKNKNLKKIIVPKKFNFNNFIKNTSIATSTMIVKRFKDKKIKFTNSTSCDDYYFKCALLKKYNTALCCPFFLTKYQLRENSVQKSRLRNLYWVYVINKNYNKLSFLENLISLIYISLNSIKKYGFLRPNK